MEISCNRKGVLTGHESSVYALERGMSAQHVYSADGNGWVVRWDLRQPDEGKLLARVPGNVFALRLLPDLGLLAVGAMNGSLHFIDLESGKARGEGLQFDASVFDMLVFGPTLLVATGNGLLWAVNLDTLKAGKAMQLGRDALRCIRKHPGKNVAVLGCSDNNAYLFDLDALKPTAKLEKHLNSVFSVAFVAGGKYLVTGSRDAHLSIWREEAGGYVLHHSIPAHMFTINDIAALPGYKLFATASRDKSIKIWSANSFELLKVIDTFKPDAGAHRHSVNKLLWLPESGTLVSGGDDRTLMLWQIQKDCAPPSPSQTNDK